MAPPAPPPEALQPHTARSSRTCRASPDQCRWTGGVPARAGAALLWPGPRQSRTARPPRMRPPGATQPTPSPRPGPAPARRARVAQPQCHR
eukprot:scaffold2183_cov140-Isochrysis_galbana.AAC.11